jgi:flagellar motor switch protein FliG
MSVLPDSDSSGTDMTTDQLDKNRAAKQNAVTRRQKAAIIVRLALANGLKVRVADLPKTLQEELVRQMTSLRHVDHSTINAAVSEFCSQFDQAGLSFPSGLPETLELLGDAISPEVERDLRKKAGLSVYADPWSRIVAQDADTLLPIVEREGTEVAAVVLSKIETTKAAAILGKLPGEQARRIAFSISLTGTIAPEIVDRIGTCVAELLDAKPVLAFSDDPIKRVGTILNFSPDATRETVLDGLEQEDAEFAKQVRKNIFTFADIPERIETSDVPRILREIDPDLTLVALAGAKGKNETTREFILSNMSKRMAEQLREDMQGRASATSNEVEEAMTQFIVAIRRMETAGELTLKRDAQDSEVAA